MPLDRDRRKQRRCAHSFFPGNVLDRRRYTGGGVYVGTGRLDVCGHVHTSTPSLQSKRIPTRHIFILWSTVYSSLRPHLAFRKLPMTGRRGNDRRSVKDVQRQWAKKSASLWPVLQPPNKRFPLGRPPPRSILIAAVGNSVAARSFFPRVMSRAFPTHDPLATRDGGRMPVERRRMPWSARRNNPEKRGRSGES